MSTPMIEMIGTPKDQGFAMFVDWRAQMAEVNGHLLQDSLDSDQITKLDLDYYLNHADFGEWLDFFTHPLVLANIAETTSLNGPQYETDFLFLNTLESVGKFDESFEDLLPNRKIKLLCSSPNTRILLNALKAKGKGSRKEDCLSAKLITSEDSFYPLYVEKIIQALELLESECEGYFSDVVNSLQYIVLTKDASFRGSSSLYHLGLTYFCPDPDWTVEKWAEELVHESSHQLLEYILYLNKAFTSENAVSDIRFKAPLRDDMRPAYGTYHALFVVCRVSSFYLSSSALNEESLPYVADIVAKSLSIYKEFVEYDFISDEGKEILDGYIYPVLENNHALLKEYSVRV